jgi:hypothetical protein
MPVPTVCRPYQWVCWKEKSRLGAMENYIKDQKVSFATGEVIHNITGDPIQDADMEQ